MDDVTHLEFDYSPYIHICIDEAGEPDIELEGFTTWEAKALLREALSFVKSMDGEWHQADDE